MHLRRIWKISVQWTHERMVSNSLCLIGSITSHLRKFPVIAQVRCQLRSVEFHQQICWVGHNSLNHWIDVISEKIIEESMFYSPQKLHWIHSSWCDCFSRTFWIQIPIALVKLFEFPSSILISFFSLNSQFGTKKWMFVVCKTHTEFCEFDGK